jgi:hypothetical protein
MRRFIETAPKDGTFVLLEEDATGKYKVACWSTEAAGWVDESAQPLKITPTYWLQIKGKDFQQEFTPSFAASQMPIDNAIMSSRSVAPAAATVTTDGTQTAPIETKPLSQARWRFAAASIVASLIVATLTSRYFSDDVMSYVTRNATLQNIFGVSAVRGPIESQSSENEQGQKLLSKDLVETRRAVEELNLKLREESATAARSLGQEREKTATLMQDVDAARQALTASAAQQRKSLEEERARSSALASELAAARRDVETKAALSSKRDDEMTQLRKAAEATVAELQEERGRSATLASELATARRDSGTKEALSNKAGEEVEQLRKDAEATTAELRRSLQAERDKAAALARDLETAQRVIGARIAPDQPANSQIGQTNSVAGPAGAEQQTASEAQNKPEASRLMARASALLAQGNIGAARTVLERAVEMGSADAIFALAETYDPNILASWGTYGTRGDALKARELYAKATVGGIQKAKDRLNALRQ